jgi:hypothetical protein
VKTIDYKTKLITRTGVLLALTIGLQLLSRSLGSTILFTGSLVNMMLIIAVEILDWQGGVSLGVFTPIIAFLLGIMKFPLVVPFIIVGNSVLVLGYYFLKSYNSYLALVVGAVAKFLVLAITVEYVLQVPPPIVQIMQLPQLYHALLGGMLAILFIKVLHRTDI